MSKIKFDNLPNVAAKQKLKPSELLQKAKQLISNPENWTQEHYAKDRDGRSTFETSPEACSWCSIGACNAVERTHTMESSCIPYLYGALKGEEGDSQGVAEFNDSATHEEVLRLFDAAIKLAIKEGK